MDSYDPLSELLKNLTPEDQQVVWDAVAKNLLGKPTEIIIRRTAKLSTLDSNEDKRKIIAKVLGRQPESLNNIDFDEELLKLSRHSNEVESLIKSTKDYLVSKNAQKDKFDELYDLGRFLVAINNKFEIKTPTSISQIPDFIIENKMGKVGIEHTRLVTTETIRLINIIKQILQDVQQILTKTSTLTGIINITLNYQKISINDKYLCVTKFTKEEKESIAKIIANYLKNFYNNDKIDKPDFVEKVIISSRDNQRLDIVLNENYIGKPDFNELFHERLKSKEKKHSNYSNHSELNELWLLIVANGVSSSSSFILPKEIPEQQITSKFAKIYLFDSFTSEYVLIK